MSAATPLDRGAEKTATLFVDDSERNSDLYWKSGFWAGDPFIFVESEGKTHLLLSDLELGRGKKESRVDEVHSYSAVLKSAREQAGGENVPYDGEIAHFLHLLGVTDLRVSASFPLRIADQLRAAGFKIEAASDPFFPDRGRKTSGEIAQLEEIQQITESAMLFAIEEIRKAEVVDRFLHLDGTPLTVERLKTAVRLHCLERGAALGELIIAPGDQGCDPHNFGSGPLSAGETIIIDIFPRHLESRFWGDMTRTVLKGTASDEQHRLYAAVAEAQVAAVDQIAPGVSGADVHQTVQEIFARAEFPTEIRDGDWVGFFHGTGHGVGLDIHELPRISQGGPPLEEGMGVTVEPGLYYPGLGGCRIEDVVVVTSDGCRNLNHAPKVLEV